MPLTYWLLTYLLLVFSLQRLVSMDLVKKQSNKVREKIKRECLTEFILISASEL